MPNLVVILGADDPVSYHVADAVMKLLRKGIELGELETVPAIGSDGTRIERKIFPRVWLRRLERAVELGAFARGNVDSIVDRILTTEAPRP